MLRLGANVAPVVFQKVVGDEGDRQLAHRLVADDLPSEPLLEARERLKAVERIRAGVRGRRHHDQLAVDRYARGQSARQRLEIGIGVGDELLAARPQPPALAAFQELRANAVEFPFDDPVLRRTERRLHVGHRTLPGLRQIEGIGAAGVERHAFRMRNLRDQRLEIPGGRGAARLRVSDHALRHPAFLDAGHLGQRLDDLQPGDADPEFAGDELEEDEPLVRRQRVDPSPNPRELLFVVERGQRQQPFAHPDVERDLLAVDAFGQQERQRLGQIADAMIAFLAEPFGKPRAFDRQTTQEAGRNGLARLAAAEEIDHPGRARPLRRVVPRRGEGVDQRRLLRPGRGGGIEPPVEIRKGLHGALSGRAPASAASSSSP